MKKKLLTASVALAMTLLTACGGNSNESSVAETEPKIKTRNETLTTTTDETEETPETTQNSTPPDDPTVWLEQPIEYEAGIVLATVTAGDKSLEIKTGDNLEAVMTELDLKYLDWSVTYTDLIDISFVGRGYALYDNEDDLPEGQELSIITFEVTDADGKPMQSLEDDKSLYSIAGVYVSDFDNSGTDVLCNAYGVTLGMSRDEINAILGDTDGDDESLYIVGDKAAVHIRYNSDDKAEVIYALPASLVKE